MHRADIARQVNKPFLPVAAGEISPALAWGLLPAPPASLSLSLSLSLIPYFFRPGSKPAVASP